jgi:hypothetical protein
MQGTVPRLSSDLKPTIGPCVIAGGGKEGAVGTDASVTLLRGIRPQVRQCLAPELQIRAEQTAWRLERFVAEQLMPEPA